MNLSNRFKNIHKGKSIAIIGSGPSAILYDEDQDISIGVNGASRLGPHFTYYMCGDSCSDKRDWFFVNCSDVRIIGNVIATMDEIIFPSEMFPKIDRFSVKVLNNPRLKNVPEPIKPHFVFPYQMIYGKTMSKDQKYLYAGATISGCALQMAHIMGSTDIHLYGCDFTHDQGKYFYNTENHGFVRDSQLKEMKSLINKLKDIGLTITVHGDSKLNE